MKISIANIKSIINMHNKELITKKKTEAVKLPPLYTKHKYTKQKLHQTFETIMKKYTTEPAKVHLNSVKETIRNNSIMKNIRQIQNFRKNCGDLKNSKQNLKYNFAF